MMSTSLKRNTKSARSSLLALLFPLALIGCPGAPDERIELGAPLSTDDVTHGERLTNGFRAVEGRPWDSPHAAIIRDGGEVVFDLGESKPVAGIYLQGDNNDQFALELSEDGESYEEVWRAPAVDGEGLRARTSPELDAKGRFVRLRAIGADAFVSVSELQIFGTLPDTWPPRVPWKVDSIRRLAVQVALFTFAMLLLLVFLVQRRKAAAALLSVDVRTLGFSRIAIGLLLLFDLAKRSTELPIWYTDEGVLPNALLAEHPFRTHAFSFLSYVDSVASVRIVFVLIALIYLCFLVGIHTRIFHVLSWLCLISLQVRSDVVANGGDFVFSHLVLWTAFLPLGAAFSLDARRLARAGKPSLRSPHVSWAFLVVLAQLAVIYYFNAVHKLGETWKDGTAVYWLAHQERIVTWFGLWMRENLPLWVFRGLTYFSLVIEYALPWLILSPLGRPWTRRIALLSGVALHLGIAVVANVGLFSFVMITYLTLLISTEDWDWIRSKLAARRGDSAPLVRALTLPPSEQMPPARRSPWRWVTGPLLAALVAVATSQALVENWAVPRYLRSHQPQWVATAMMTFRLYQGWVMFAPDAPRYDMWIVVDAVTEDGRHVDPLNEVASRYADPSLRRLPPRLEQNYYWCDYVSMIADHRAYHSGLAEWIFRHHERTGKEADRIVSFRAYRVSHASPEPGAAEPTNVESKLFMVRSRK